MRHEKAEGEQVGGGRNREARQGTATRSAAVTGFYTYPDVVGELTPLTSSGCFMVDYPPL
jgi:hypothetical protein